MVTQVIENIEEFAILDTVKKHYDSDYNFDICLIKEYGNVVCSRWQVINRFGGTVAVYSPESKILTMLITRSTKKGGC